MSEPAPTNAPELTVSELSGALKRTIEDRFGFVRLRGEISNYRGPHSSGHAYFCLKDATARIDAVIWKSAFGRLKTKPQEGLEVVATGKITTFPGKSSYQIVIEALEPAGIGALMALFEERRRKLAAEGLFAAERKQLLPFLPTSIGIVTSPTGAVIRDILHRIAERFPCHILVWPVRVQGDTAAEEVAAAIEGFNALPASGLINRPDVIIVARGGGSLEDLWAFNEEIVVRAAANSLIPLIAAVGHETDWTLIDHAADLRAPTPTAAAEKAVPVRSELLANLNDLGRRHFGAVLRLLQHQRSDLRALARALPQAEDILALPRQRFDRAVSGLQSGLARGLDQNRLRLARASHRLASQSPHAKMARAAQQLEAKGQRLIRAFRIAQDKRQQHLGFIDQRLRTCFWARLRQESQQQASLRQSLKNLDQRLRRGLRTVLIEKTNRLASLDQLLKSLSYAQVLARGFTLTRDAQGKPLRLAAEVHPNALLEIEFFDGRKTVQAKDFDASPETKASPSKPKPKTEQGSLF